MLDTCECSEVGDWETTEHVLEHVLSGTVWSGLR